MIVDSCVREQQVEEPGALGELDGAVALVGEQLAHDQAEVLLVGQGRRQREGEAVVVRLAVDVGGEVVLAAVLVRYRVLEEILVMFQTYTQFFYTRQSDLVTSCVSKKFSQID